MVSRLSGRQVQHNPLPLEEGLGLGRLGRLLFDSVQVRRQTDRRWRSGSGSIDRSVRSLSIKTTTTHSTPTAHNRVHQGTYWLFAERALFQVALAREEEGRFVWRLYLEKALQVRAYCARVVFGVFCRRWDR